MTLGFHLELCASVNLHVLEGTQGCGNGEPLCSTDACCWRLEEGELLHTLSLHGLPFCCMINPHDQSNLWKEEFILAYGSETESIMVGGGWWGRGMAAGCWGRRLRDRLYLHPQKAERATNGVRLITVKVIHVPQLGHIS